MGMERRWSPVEPWFIKACSGLRFVILLSTAHCLLSPALPPLFPLSALVLQMTAHGSLHLTQTLTLTFMPASYN